jgi:hypothetical protein
MIFYKNVLISTILSALILLAIVGGVMFYYRSTQLYPPTINDCPDNYILNSVGKCERTSLVTDPTTDGWSTNGPPNTDEGKKNAAYGQKAFLDSNSCALLSFADNSYLLPGSSEGSGICNKKRVAEYCGATWDGITNNYSIC